MFKLTSTQAINWFSKSAFKHVHINFGSNMCVGQCEYHRGPYQWCFCE